MTDLRFKAVLVLTYVWATVLGYLNTVFKTLLRYILQNSSDTMTPVIGNKKHPLKILMAGMEGNKIITNKVRLYMQNKWDTEFCNGEGGANFHELGEILNASFLWISYVLSDEEILRLGKTLNKKTNKVYSVAINLKSSIMQTYEREASKLESALTGNEEILFRQCPLPHN